MSAGIHHGQFACKAPLGGGWEFSLHSRQECTNNVLGGPVFSMCLCYSRVCCWLVGSLESHLLRKRHIMKKKLTWSGPPCFALPRKLPSHFCSSFPPAPWSDAGADIPTRPNNLSKRFHGPMVTRLQFWRRSGFCCASLQGHIFVNRCCLG